MIYLGATLALVGAYISCAVLVVPLPLPLLLSERRNRAFRRGVGAFIVEGHELRARPVSGQSRGRLARRLPTRTGRCARQAWLDKNARPTDAAAFEHAIGPSQEILDSFDRAHNDLRLKLSWQLERAARADRKSPEGTRRRLGHHESGST